MEEDKPKRSLFGRIITIIQIIIGLAIIWILSSLVTAIISYWIIYVCNGKCNADLVEEYQTYIRTGYGVLVTICSAVYLRYMNDKYKILK